MKKATNPVKAPDPEVLVYVTKDVPGFDNGTVLGLRQVYNTREGRFNDGPPVLGCARSTKEGVTIVAELPFIPVVTEKHVRTKKLTGEAAIRALAELAPREGFAKAARPRCDCGH